MSEPDIRFSLYSPGDHEGFVACINDFYKGGYPYPRFLDKAGLETSMEKGQLIATVAKTSDGRIVGTSAAMKLDGVFEGSVLLLLRCVVSDMQRLGIGSRQEVFLLENIRKAFPNALSLYADVMTHDAASQKTMVRKGFSLCGLRLMLYKNELIVPKLSFPPGTKMTQAIYCKKNADCTPALQVPSEHRTFIEEIYKNLDISPIFLPERSGIGSGRWTKKVIPLHCTAEFHIYENPGNPGPLLSEIRDVLSMNYTCVCYLCASKDGAVPLYRALISEGFYFTGIKPLSATGEYLVLCQTAGCIPSFDLVALPDDKQYFLQYIKENLNL